MPVVTKEFYSGKKRAAALRRVDGSYGSEHFFGPIFLVS